MKMRWSFKHGPVRPFICFIVDTAPALTRFANSPAIPGATAYGRGQTVPCCTVCGHPRTAAPVICYPRLETGQGS
jgi:hypothetical protein